MAQQLSLAILMLLGATRRTPFRHPPRAPPAPRVLARALSPRAEDLAVAARREVLFPIVRRCALGFVRTPKP